MDAPTMTSTPVLLAETGKKDTKKEQPYTIEWVVVTKIVLLEM
jgi:hypothetical protein